LPWPILSSIAAASQGVATSRLMGPAPSRHHSPPKQAGEDHRQTPITIASRLTQRSPVSHSCTLQTCRPADEIWNWTRQQPTRAMRAASSGSLIPAGRIVPLRDVGLGTRIRPLGRSIPSHCLSVPALRLIAARGALFDRYRTLLCRHRCQSSINTVTRGRAQGLIGLSHRRADGGSVEFLVTILPGHQTCPAAGANPTVKGETRNTLMVDLRKATKGRRMSKKTRKKSSKPAPKSRKTPARKPPAARLHRKPLAAATPLRPKSLPPRPPANRPNRRQGGRQRHRPKPLSTIASHKQTSKSLKSNLSAALQSRFREPNWSRAR
jgi:hypothetical protein